MTIETILIVIAFLSLLLGLYNFLVSLRITRSIIWILEHVMIVSKKDQGAPDFEKIKKMFGIEEEDHGK